MKELRLHKAFTLIELLTVIIIIGLIAASALIVLKENAQLKANQYTKTVMQSFKNGIVYNAQGNYVRGFVNDFGTVPPSIGFIVNRCDNAFFIDDTQSDIEKKLLQRYRFLSMSEQNGTQFAAPFMDDCSSGDDQCKDSSALASLNLAPLDSGFFGGYVQNDEDAGLKDGWGNELEYVNTIDDHDRFISLISYGSDGIKNQGQSLLKDEFNEFDDNESLKGLYADDLVMTFQSRKFKPRNISFDIALNAESQVVIYSPMLYYVEGSSGDALCEQLDASYAECDGMSKPYQAYIEGAVISDNMWWHIGIIKYEFGIENNSINFLHINNSPIDRKNDFMSGKFLISAGVKEVVVADENGSIAMSFSKHIFPDQALIIRYPR